MTTRSHLTMLLLIGLFASMSASPTVASDAAVPLSEEKVTLEKIKQFFDAAFLTAEFDKDGDLRIEDGGLNTFVRLDKERKMITFFSIWGLKASVSEIKKLQFINTLNDELILVRFCMPSPTVLWCDYQFLYERGITPYATVNNYRLFANVVRGALSKDTEDIIGSD